MLIKESNLIFWNIYKNNKTNKNIFFNSSLKFIK